MIKSILLLVFLNFGLGFSLKKEVGEMIQELINKDTISTMPILAVIPFEVADNLSDKDGKAVAEVAIAHLAASGKYKVVDRADFAKVIQELELAQSDMVTNEGQSQLGELLSAERMLVGSITEAFGDRLITARIVDIESGKVISSASTTVKPSVMNSAVKELLGEKSQISATVFRSMAIPGWGQFYTNHPVRGSLSFLAFVGMVGATTFFAIDAAGKQTDWEEFASVSQKDYIRNNCSSPLVGAFCPDPASVKRDSAYYVNTRSSKRSDYESAFDNMVLFGILSVGAWGLNLVDASFAGMQSKKKFDLYFSYQPYGQSGTLRLSWSF